MASLVYRAKRFVRTPLIWQGRRRHADEPPAVKERLERHLYRKKAWDLWACTVIDPHYFYRAELDADSVIVDVGAFTGHVAEEFFDLYGAHVHAFEPSPRFHDEMARRLEGNDHIHPYNYGLGKADATMALSEDGMASSFEIAASYRDGTPTTTVSIRDAAAAFDEIGLERIDFIKINIEGGEFDLIDRLYETGWLDRTRYVLVQFHEWYDKAELRRWKSRRQLKATHRELWSCPWIYEMWCHRDQLPAEPDPEAVAAFIESLRASAAAQQAAADGSN
ncbi:MAG: FkbM family methyltransferase [Acidimicrobiales bacterium]|nr:FkbM family methyltransferase [Acidimicrobiales bacterium]